MIRPTIRILTRFALIPLAVLGVGLGALAFRLAQGPLAVEFLSPVIEKALSPSSGAYQVRIGGTWLSLDPERRSIDIVAHDVVLTGATGETIAGVPEVALGFSLRAALSGVVAPTRIILHEPHLLLIRDADGGFQLNLTQEGEGGDKAGETNSRFAQDMLEDLAAPPNRAAPLGYLAEVSVSGGSLLVEDRKLGLSWRLPRVTVSARRDMDGASAKAAFALAVDDTVANLDGSFVYHRSERKLEAALGFGDWQLSKLARIFPALAPLAGAQMPIGGRIAFSLDTETLGLAGARIEFTSGPGTLASPDLPGGGIALSGGGLRAEYDPEAGALRLAELSLDLGGPRLRASGKVLGLGRDRLDEFIKTGGFKTEGIGGAIDIGAEFTVHDMPAAALEKYWPQSLVPGARNWITKNIRQGSVDEAALQIGLSLPRLEPGGAPDLDLKNLAGSMRMRGLTVDYRAPLQAVQGVDGTAVFDQKTMTITPASGTVRSVHVTGGKIVISGLDAKDQDIAIDLAFEGALRDVLEELDRKPFEYAKEIGIDPKEVAGGAHGRVSFKFPLIQGLRFDQVAFTVAGELAGLGVRDALFGQDLEDGSFHLDMDRTALALTGKGQLAGAPAELVWNQSLRLKDPVKSRYSVKAVLDGKARERLKLRIPMVSLSGTVPTTAALRNFRDGRSEADISFDLEAAELGLPLLGWSKPEGAKASGQMQLLLKNDRLQRMRNAVISGAGLDIRLGASFLGTFDTVQRIDFSRFEMGDTSLTGSLTRRGEGWSLQTEGARLDAAALFHDVGKADEKPQAEPPLAIDARIGRVMLGPGREARAVAAHLFKEGMHWQSIDVQASPQGSGQLSVHMATGAPDHPIAVSTDNLGASLALLKVSDNVVGGKFSLTGRAHDKGPDRGFTGHFEGADYHVIHAPVLAKLLSLASFASIDSLLSGEGIPFTRLVGSFSATPSVINIEKASAYGGAIGVTAEGAVDLGRDTIDLSGTLVPAYTLNSILGNIPFLGDLLLGGEGKGIFAANYRLAGPSADPKISLNPLSALAPGFLRNLFLFDPGNPAPEKSQ